MLPLDLVDPECVEEVVPQVRRLFSELSFVEPEERKSVPEEREDHRAVALILI